MAVTYGDVDDGAQHADARAVAMGLLGDEGVHACTLFRPYALPACLPCTVRLQVAMVDLLSPSALQTLQYGRELLVAHDSSLRG